MNAVSTNFTNNDINDGAPSFSSWPAPSELESGELALLILYSIVFVVGVTGNILIILAACQNARHLPVRNNLLINLCISDLLVTAISGPISAAMSIQKGSIGLNWLCKTMFYIQSLPVAASTFSLMMLSLDRYAAVKHPRIFSRLCQEHLAAGMIGVVWIGAALVSAPILYVRTIISAEYVGICEEIWGSGALRLTYLLCHAFIVFVVPGVTVAVCHASVGSRLYRTASSLASAPIVTAAAACELQLRQLQRPARQMVLIAKEQPSRLIPCPIKTQDEENSSDEGGLKELQIAADLASLREQDAEIERRKRRNSKIQANLQATHLRAIRSDRTIVRANRRLRPARNLSRPVRPPLVKTYSAQSFRSRRRLATMLMALVAVFAACWIPFLTCSITNELLPDNTSAKEISLLLLPFFLLLGHAHSAINPVVYWLLNRNFLQKVQRALSLRSCVPLPVKLAQFRIPAMNRNSSTNEGALGAFHPKYNTPRANTGHRQVRPNPAHAR